MRYELDGTQSVRAVESYEGDDDCAPIEMLTALFEARGWPCEATRDELSGEIQGSWATYQVKGIWREEDNVLQVLCLPDVRVAKEHRPAANELATLVNEQLWLGHFEIWSQGGVILYRHALMLGDDGLLGLDMAQFAIESAISECDRFYPAFQFVLWGDKNPAEALDAALVDAAGEA